VPAKAWHVRRIRALIYGGLCVAAVGVAYSSFADAKEVEQGFVAARELYGLWALGLLVAAMMAGPLNYVLPWLPIRPHLMLGRRALGVSAFILATLHVLCYVGPTVYRNWRQLYTPGALWIAGLLLAVPLFSVMLLLTYTSRDRAVQEWGPRRWKKLHRSVYWLLPLALVHATFVGADFGVNKGPDVSGDPDSGSLFGMLAVSAGWLLFYILRRRGIRWYLKSGR
jgi:DMSO/TMAO reductase YedYZ heme-binding membrane subunit